MPASTGTVPHLSSRIRPLTGWAGIGGLTARQRLRRGNRVFAHAAGDEPAAAEARRHVVGIGVNRIDLTRRVQARQP